MLDVNDLPGPPDRYRIDTYRRGAGRGGTVRIIDTQTGLVTNATTHCGEDMGSAHERAIFAMAVRLGPQSMVLPPSPPRPLSVVIDGVPYVPLAAHPHFDEMLYALALQYDTAENLADPEHRARQYGRLRVTVTDGDDAPWEDGETLAMLGARLATTPRPSVLD